MVGPGSGDPRMRLSLALHGLMRTACAALLLAAAVPADQPARQGREDGETLGLATRSLA